MAVTDRVQPYIDRLLEDRELQRDLRELASALRGGYGRAEKKGRKPTRLLGDRKFTEQLQRAGESLKDAGLRFQGEKPKRHRGRRIVVAVLVIGGGVLAVREMFKQPGPDAPYG
jgi:hypothetical protein